MHCARTRNLDAPREGCRLLSRRGRGAGAEKIKKEKEKKTKEERKEKSNKLAEGQGEGRPLALFAQLFTQFSSSSGIAMLIMSAL